jgi:quinol monooxygenase YgiN
MITFTVRMSFRPEDLDEVTRSLRELTRLSRQEPGCATYVAHWVESEPGTVLIYEQYKDQHAVEHHRETEHFRTYAIGSLYQKMLERQVENLNAIS